MKTSFATAVLLGISWTCLRASEFSFDAPAGPQFTEQQRQRQREAGARIHPLVLEACRSGAASVRILPGTFDRNQAPTLRNITITGNTFDRPAGRAIALPQVDGLHLSGNRFGP